MLKNAKLYEDRINNWFYEHQYDIDVQRASCGQGMTIDSYPEDNRSEHNFASINENDELLGCLGYSIDWVARSVNGLWIIRCGDKPSARFVYDVLEAIDNIFYKYNLNRIEWMAYADNPAVKGYHKFCKRYGGREVGTLKNKAVLLDGQPHDEIIFELLKEDYCGYNRNNNK